MNVNELPAWQKRGIGIRWGTVAKEGVNPISGEVVQALRRRLLIDLERPIREDYIDYLNGIIDAAEA